jgi:transcriptional regulator with XRE-family HTH domain
MARLRVRELSEQKGLTVAELSKLSGVNHETIYQIWNNEANPTIKTLSKLATALKCPVNDLLVDEQKQE